MPSARMNRSSKKLRRAKIAGGDQEAAVVLNRIAVKTEKLVYVIVSNKGMTYGKSKSRIVYFGTTSRGVDRVLNSLANKAREALGGHGTKRIEVHVYTVRARQNVQMWRKLEQGLILSFKDAYGCVPKYNNHGKNMQWTDQALYLSKTGLKNIVKRYEN